MAEGEDRFLSRWARRKAESRPETEQAEPSDSSMAHLDEAGPADLPAREAAGAEERGEAAPEGDPEVVAKLPDIESLDAGSDFTAFMQEGVPQALKRRALRRLWRLNPLFAHLDGLNDYDDDFTDAAMVVEGMQTLFQVGKGMPDRRAMEPEEEAEAVAAGPEDEADGEGESAAPEHENVADDQPERAAPEALIASSDLPPAADPSAAAVASAADDSAPLERVGSGRSARARRWGGFET